MYYPCSENKGADQLRGYRVIAKLICVFVFAYAKSQFSHDAAQMKFHAQLNMKSMGLVNVKMPFIVGILEFIEWTNFMLILSSAGIVNL